MFFAFFVIIVKVASFWIIQISAVHFYFVVAFRAPVTSYGKWIRVFMIRFVVFTTHTNDIFIRYNAQIYTPIKSDFYTKK